MFSELLIIVVLIFFNGLMNLAELALVSARKSRLQSEAEAGDLRAEAALALAQDPSRFLSTVQVGITLTGSLAGVYGGVALVQSLSEVFSTFPLTAQYREPLAYGVVVVTISYLSLMMGELVPKRLALHAPERISKTVTPLVRFFSFVFSPVARFLQRSTDIIVKMLPFYTEGDSSVTEDEIKLLISQGSEEGIIEETEEKIVHKVFRLGDRLASSVMTPRNDLVWLNFAEPLDEIWFTALESGYSYFPVGEGSVEKLLGIISIRDLALCVVNKRADELVHYLDEPLKVPSSMTALRVLELLKEGKKRIAVVIDEYGGIDGLITTHDLMEAIVGELSDDEESEPQVTKRPDGSFLVDARMNIDDLMHSLDVTFLPEDENKGYHSLGGFIMRALGHLPREGETFEYGGYSFEVIDMDRLRVDKVLICKLENPTEQAGSS